MPIDHTMILPCLLMGAESEFKCSNMQFYYEIGVLYKEAPPNPPKF